MLPMLPLLTSVISWLFGAVFFIWFACFWWAVLLGSASLALQGFVSVLFDLWEFVIYWIIPAVSLALSVGVIRCKNPINSLFCLIGVFMTAILLLLAMRVEFLSMIFLIVYIGAIAILFLFVIMLLNLRNLAVSRISSNLGNYTVLALLAGLTYSGFLFFSEAVEFATIFNAKLATLTELSATTGQEMQPYFFEFKYGFNDVLLFSELLYTQHLVLLLLSGILLLAAMVGSIVLAISTVEEQ